MKSDKFILDAHFGKLARYLRMLGFDTVYDRALNDEQIIQISLQENRAILSKDRALLLDRRVKNGYFVNAKNLGDQLIEVIKHFDMVNKFNPFTRCLLCNGKIITVDKKNIQEEVLLSIFNQYENFTRCLDCKKVFWEGSHHQKMSNFIAELSLTLR